LVTGALLNKGLIPLGEQTSPSVNSLGEQPSPSVCEGDLTESFSASMKHLEELQFELQEERRQQAESKSFLARKASELEALEARLAERERRLSEKTSRSSSRQRSRGTGQSPSSPATLRALMTPDRSEEASRTPPSSRKVSRSPLTSSPGALRPPSLPTSIARLRGGPVSLRLPARDASTQTEGTEGGRGRRSSRVKSWCCRVLHLGYWAHILLKVVLFTAAVAPELLPESLWSEIAGVAPAAMEVFSLQPPSAKPPPAIVETFQGAKAAAASPPLSTATMANQMEGSTRSTTTLVPETPEAAAPEPRVRMPWAVLCSFGAALGLWRLAA